MSLYQSYRPKNFSDVVGQDFVKKVLQNSCKTRTFHHGYIFFGFHGIGKTTLARLFAEAVNCTNITPDGNPCHACPNCIAYDNGRMIDVIEIDAASYTGVDNIREVIDHAKFTPTQGTYKVYIIDEVHMLSKWAFNALLKTLEEPPAHTIFLLATTEIHKIPDTILSRVIRFDLTKIKEKDMEELLIKMCTTEWISFEKNALKMIVHRSRGSIRDSLTMLEKCIIEKSVTEKNVEEGLHLVSPSFLWDTFEAVRSGESEKIQHIVATLENESTDVRQFSAQMTEWIVEHIHEAFEQKAFPTYKAIFDLFTQIFSQSRQVAVPMDILRMALYEKITTGTLKKIDKGIMPPWESGIAKKQISQISSEQITNIPEKEVIEEKEKNMSSLPPWERGVGGIVLEEIVIPEAPPLSEEIQIPSEPLPIEADALITVDVIKEDLPLPPEKADETMSWTKGAWDSEAEVVLEKVIDKINEPSEREENQTTSEILPAEEPVIIDESIFSVENFIKKLQTLGIKTTLLPLLRTATMGLYDGEITITTTSFGKGRCEEVSSLPILRAAAEEFSAHKLTIITEAPAEVPEDTIDIARAIFE